MFHATSEYITRKRYDHVVCTESGQRASYDGIDRIVFMLYSVAS